MPILFFTLLSLCLVSFGQPASSSTCGFFAACIGYALFWRVLLLLPTTKFRFWFSFVWFSFVQLLQLSWFIQHPFAYIYGPYLFFSVAIGAQFAWLSLFVTEARVRSLRGCFALAGLWTLFEWIRLFFMAGYTWNPVGLALTVNLYSMQFASVAGVYGLSFVVVLTNMLFLRALLGVSVRSFSLFGIVTLLPYLFGFAYVHYHDRNKTEGHTTVALVQTAFPAEETLSIVDGPLYKSFILEQWGSILSNLKKHERESLDLIVLPEMVVNMGTYYPVFRFEDVKDLFVSRFGNVAERKFPGLDPHLAVRISLDGQTIWMVDNAYILQAIANIFACDVVAGLQDEDLVPGEKRKVYNAAQTFRPGGGPPLRYAKRVLLPMGEYIPFSFCQQLAAKYGVGGSFTPGDKALVVEGKKVPFGVSICYEETFGNLMRENRSLGAEMLVNLTSDVWYPNSKLTKQHLDHSRLRTVEMGIPLVRACNTGVTCALDSYGNFVGILGEGDPHQEWISDALLVKVPTYHFKTIYSLYGDALILLFSVFCLVAEVAKMGKRS